ncbi:hypothetical protein SIL04_10060 [Bacillus cereus group sp. BfR-BA-00331]|uniref:hypothetical protein n=1 Tax=Bacillus cereus group TaxID=86661 RepID=UPI000772A70C|nr:MULTISPECIES: hypothetical protein [Bacillus cereus group]ONG70134.1 hypothetical protein BKK44_14030 [Bacillus cereus]MDA2192079.1 hypothetical protein [Bacillus cereus group sp. Bc238]MDA2197580.1 hypothetical protein [Bacillus cereus group sp. Bc237]MDA2756296.1 hypothetical protein [Bacillus cereus group sp. Bc007]MDA2761739.1 hypothetical protein [Bacillus cereus group sp. Bc008]
MTKSINFEAFMRTPAGRKLQAESEKYIADLKAERDKKKETLEKKDLVYRELLFGANQLRSTQLYRTIEGVPSIVETDDSSRITKISPLKGFGEIDSALAQQIKEKDPLTYRRLRANDLKDIPKTDAYYESEIYSENCPVEVFDAYIVRPSKDPQSPRYAEDWMGYYENLSDYEKGDSIHLKQTVNLYSEENVRGMAQEIRDIQKEIESIEKEIY